MIRLLDLNATRRTYSYSKWSADLIRTSSIKCRCNSGTSCNGAYCPSTSCNTNTTTYAWIPPLVWQPSSSISISSPSPRHPRPKRLSPLPSSQRSYNHRPQIRRQKFHTLPPPNPLGPDMVLVNIIKRRQNALWTLHAHKKPKSHRNLEPKPSRSHSRPVLL